MYDIIYVKRQNDQEYAQLRMRFPLLKTVDYVEDRLQVLQAAQKKSMTKMFWLLDDSIRLLEDTDFLYKVPDRDSKYIHLFKYHIYLIPKKYEFSREEIELDIFKSHKTIDLTLSQPTYDVVFISYNEPNADENYKLLISKIPSAKRVHGVKGIHQAHIAAAKLAITDMFYVVDGDAQIVDGFDFDHKVAKTDKNTVHTWRSINPINGLIYGYGGIKLLPTALTRDLNVNSVDMTTNISKKFKPIEEISNITAFNTDEFNTWKSAFRECVKLSSGIIKNQDKKTIDRLKIWCTKGQDNPHGSLAIKGAKAGRKYGREHAGNALALANINDWTWLQEQYRKNTKDN